MHWNIPSYKMRGFRYLYQYWLLASIAVIIILKLFIESKDILGNISKGNSYLKIHHMFLNEKYRNCKSRKMPLSSSFQSEWHNATTDGKVLVYSAYTIGTNVLTIIGIAEWRELFPFCQMWSKTESGYLSLVSVREAKIIYLPEAHKKRYIPSFISCSFTMVTEPSAVSVVVGEPCAKPLHTLPILSSAKLLRRKFTACVSPLFGSIGGQLIEWIEMNRILGADYFVFYNYPVSETDKKILSYYSKRGIAEVNQWDIPLGEGSVHYNGQIAAINDCILRHRDKTDFVAVLDLDEFIFPKHEADTTWHDMLKRLPSASSYIFSSVLFPTQWSEPKRRENIKANMKYPLDIFSKLIREKFTQNRHSKTILNPRTIDIAGIHFVHEHTEGYSIAIPEDIGLVHHYRETKGSGHTPRNVSDKTVMKYRDVLLKNTENVWEDLWKETD